MVQAGDGEGSVKERFVHEQEGASVNDIRLRCEILEKGPWKMLQPRTLRAHGWHSECGCTLVAGAEDSTRCVRLGFI